MGMVPNEALLELARQDFLFDRFNALRIEEQQTYAAHHHRLIAILQQGDTFLLRHRGTELISVVSVCL